MVLIHFCIFYKRPGKKDPYAISWKKWAQHEVPKWFNDAKFGTCTQLEGFCVQAHTGEWNTRYMCTKGHEVLKYHKRTYGMVSASGDHDFIPTIKLENFDANEWVGRYKHTGAKFAGPVAEYHDEFNLADYYAKIPGTHITATEYANLYGNLPIEQGYERWLITLEEGTDNYQPGPIWFDWRLRAIPKAYKRKFLLLYKRKRMGKEVLITRKNHQLPVGAGVRDLKSDGTFEPELKTQP